MYLVIQCVVYWYCVRVCLCVCPRRRTSFLTSVHRSLHVASHRCFSHDWLIKPPLLIVVQSSVRVEHVNGYRLDSSGLPRRRLFVSRMLPHYGVEVGAYTTTHSRPAYTQLYRYIHAALLLLPLPATPPDCINT
jgi:hypothetical protein